MIMKNELIEHRIFLYTYIENTAQAETKIFEGKHQVKEFANILLKKFLIL